MKLTRGQIIRRKSENGGPIGPYIRITQATNYFVYGCPIGMNIEVLMHRKNVYVPPMVKLPVRPLKFQELCNKITTTVTHKLSPKYEKMLKNPPELVCFYDNMDGDHRVYCEIAEIKQELLACELHVRLTIGAIILIQL